MIINNRKYEGTRYPEEWVIDPSAEVIESSEAFAWGEPYTPCGAQEEYQPAVWLVLASLNGRYYVVECRKYWHGGVNSGDETRDDVLVTSSNSLEEARNLFRMIHGVALDTGRSVS